MDLNGRRMSSNSAVVTPIEELDKILGTPSAQRVFRILVCWGKLSLKEIVARSNFSESQVHLTLTHLEKAQIVKKESRGIYTLTNVPFVHSLKRAYTELLITRVGMKVYRLSKEMENLTPVEVGDRLDNLIFHWQPILEQNYRLKLSSLVNYSLNRYREEHQDAVDNRFSNPTKN